MEVETPTPPRWGPEAGLGLPACRCPKASSGLQLLLPGLHVAPGLVMQNRPHAGTPLPWALLKES